MSLLLVRSRDPSRDLLGDFSLDTFGELSLDLRCDLSLEPSLELLFDLSLDPSSTHFPPINLSSRLVLGSAASLLDELSVELLLLNRTLTDSLLLATKSSDSLLRLLVSRGKAPLTWGGGEGESPGASYSGVIGASYTGDPSTSEAGGD